ncbi:MAG: DUF2752 domain-containing protein [Deltaproteobacteria bacterium]|nr:DUF2752 domain-containing protein [Deltaproteobacteria bacterium]
MYHVTGNTKWTRPDSYWDVVVAHLPIALLTGLGLFLPIWVAFHTLPFMKCTFLCVTGFPCPFCGFTRSLWSISAGEWYFAVRNCPLSLGVYGLMVIFFTWHSTALLLGIKMKSGLYPLCRSVHTWWIIGAIFFLNWVYRISVGLT